VAVSVGGEGVGDGYKRGVLGASLFVLYIYIFYFRFVRYEMRDRTKIRFWHDLWCEDQPLKESFLDLFCIACCKEAWVADHLLFSNGNIQWNLSFIRPMQDWEVELVIAFFNVLYLLKVRLGGEDSIWWIPSKRKKFEVRSFYQTLSIPSSSSFPWKTIWRVKVPSRVSFFVWIAALGKILSFWMT
jgi:hypothetical protein